MFFTLPLIVHKARVSDDDSLKSGTLKNKADYTKQGAFSKDGPGPTCAFLLQNEESALSVNIR